MPPVSSIESGTYRAFTKKVGTEPLPGYRLIEPLGRGGFGEVWKCEAPGGLMKAIKFVAGSDAEDGNGGARFEQELDAFQQIKSIRHPFLLTLERVEIIDGELVMVMELADRQLLDRFRECHGCGLPGIPRDELLHYFADAAEALDMIAAKHGLQHLDVKPANLFLVAGHVKVGDYGLVARLDPDGAKSTSGGLTPKYVSPEALLGKPSAQSDQYSLALVYQELLTGTFPYTGRKPQQLMIQHISTEPDLSGLPKVDQPIMAQALAKKPEERFSSCMAFIQALMAAASAVSLPRAGMEVRRARVERSMVDMNLPTAQPIDDADSTGNRQQSEITQNHTLVGDGPTAPGKPALPKLAGPGKSSPVATPAPRQPHAKSSAIVSPAPRQPQPKSAPVITPAPISVFVDPAGNPAKKFAVLLNPIKTIVTVARLTGMESVEPTISKADFPRVVVEYVTEGSYFPQLPGDIGQLANGTWVCQFPSTVAPSVMPRKLDVICEQWGLNIEQPDSSTIILRGLSRRSLWGSLSGKKHSGMQVAIKLSSSGKSVGEITLSAGFFGTPDQGFASYVTGKMSQIITDIRRELKNVDDRRRHARISTNFMVTLYPIHGDGGIDTPVTARCRDISLGGLCVATESPIPTKYAYVAFDGIGSVAGQAVLVKFLRTQFVNRECHLGGQYRIDL
jgi:serine/threonine protein kinase